MHEMPPQSSVPVERDDVVTSSSSPCTTTERCHLATDTADEEKERKLSTYLDSFLSLSHDDVRYKGECYRNRIECCGSSPSLYCSQCCRLLVRPKSMLWPKSVYSGTLKLPFDLHVVLDDRRTSAAGLHAVTLLEASWRIRCGRGEEGGGKEQEEEKGETIRNGVNQAVSAVSIHARNDLSSHQEEMANNIYGDILHRIISETTLLDDNATVSDDSQKRFSGKNNRFISSLDKPPVTLIDLERNDPIPKYSASSIEDEQNEEQGMTCILFPSPHESVPLASVVSKITRLVVLDCKWSNTNCKDHPELAKLQKVHLTSPLEKTHYWRWHNSGSGMLSTIEAIYFAALEVAKHLQLSLDEDGNNTNSFWDSTNTESLIDIMWLFALQRAAICRSSPTSKNGDDLPFTDAGKEARRALRRTAGTEKQVKDKEKGKKLREEARRQRRQEQETIWKRDILKVDHAQN